jgi:hypothetical protein
MRLVTTACAAAAAIVCFHWGAPAPAEEYRDGVRHCSFTLPTGWGEMPPDALAAINKFAKKRLPGKDIKYDHAFMRIGDKPGSYPYVLMQTQPVPTGGATYDDIEKELKSLGASVRRAEGALSDLSKGISVGEATLDRTHNRVTVRMEMDVSGVGKVQEMGFGFIGAKEIVFLHCYDLDADFERRVPVFVGLADSFKFNPGFDFTPAPSRAPLGFDMSRVLSYAIIGAAVGGLLGLAVVVIRFLSTNSGRGGSEEPIDLGPYQDD